MGVLAEKQGSSMNIYTIRFKCQCPSDAASILYIAKIKSQETIMVEDLIKFAEGFSLADAYHEIIADKMIERFPSTHQIITAVHQGVKVKTVR